jgi:hypothetical protein
MQKGQDCSYTQSVLHLTTILHIEGDGGTAFKMLTEKMAPNQLDTISLGEKNKSNGRRY